MSNSKLSAALSKLYMHNGRAMTLQAILEQTVPMVAEETDGMIDYSRTRFNRMDHREQDAYMDSLKAKRLFFVNNIKVPKIVYEWAREQSNVR